MVTAQDVMTPSDYMARALFLAERGRGRTSPNPLVGAVIVSPEGVVVGSGFHARAGEAHAEVRALDEAGAAARGGTLYCTLEPCCHVGRTGPCVVRIVEAGVARVVAAVEDPNPLVCGRGFAFLRAHGVEVEVGLQAAAAMRINLPFFTRHRSQRPLVTLKAALSADGCVAAAPGQRTRLTSAAANRHAHWVRAEVDAIAVGAGTILADDPLLTARGAYRAQPLVRVIFDRRLRTPPTARVLSTVDAGPVIIVTSADQLAGRESGRQALERRGARVLVTRTGMIREALGRLAADWQLGSLLLEGGAAIHAAAWEEGVVDIVRLYVTPHVIGAGGVAFLPAGSFWSGALRQRRVEPLGPDVMIEGYVHRID
ncbi:MAG: bifunctional diaminohydroxyphosphoribosylaminopyrimidine deaminase/5-amino-6-(5-phosphoribosylamino)uracil reductase RibD [Acidimicrobiia bacterium]|nr:bifunctional diaminohydroxyphosphoribosylaminopyrimidine deaminase/5-amino-6-(5-phosphoribosylamino)uracil reductase RibD [Acidimicrobiia bacterium]